MVLSVFSPIQIAEASGTITKTITVLGPDGAPYEGASVGMSFQAEVGSASKTNAVTPVTTNASGVASITFSETFIYGQISVQPREADTTTAIYTNYLTDHANADPLTVNLKKSSVRIATLLPNGQAAPAFGGVANGYREWFWLLRSGAVNINITDTAPTDVCGKFTIYASDEVTSAFRRIFGSKITGSGETRTVTLYNDPGTCAVEAPKIDGVYQLRFNAGNISGNLLSNNGQALSFSANQGYEVQLYAVNSNGSKNTAIPSTFSYVRSDGSWDTYVDTATAGRYELTFTGYGNPDYPSFTRQYLWVTSDNKLSWSADGTDAANSISKNFNLPNPNLKFSFIDTATGLNVPVNIEISRKIDGTNIFDTTWWSYLDGKPTFSVDDGEYKFALNPLTGGDKVTLSFTFASGVGTLTSSSKSTYSVSDNLYTVWLPANNFAIKIVDASNNSVSGWVDFCPDNGQCTHVNANASGLASGFIANGDYPTLWINPGGNENLSSIRLSASVANGVLSITGKTPSDGVYTLVLPAPNIKFTVTHPVTQNTITQGWIGFESADSNWNSTGYVGHAEINGNLSGYARTTLADGKYLATINVHNVAANAGLASKTYRVTVTGGVASLSYNGSDIALVNGKFPVTPAASNLEVSFQDLSGIPTNDGWLEVCQDLGGGDTTSCRGYGFNNSGQISQSLANGNWVITVRPNSGTGMSAKKYSVSVSGGVATVADATKVDGRWILTGSSPNISGSFTLSTGILTFGDNQGISLSIQKYNNGNWEWQNGGSWVRSTTYALNVTAQGRYRIVASPINFTELVQSYSSEFWVDSSGNVSTAVDGTYVDSITAFSILIKSPNLKLKVINPQDNSLLPGGWVSIQKINGQNRSWISNADIFNSNPGLTGSSITEIGDYSLIVNPPNGSNAIVGLAVREYLLKVDANDSMTVTLNGESVTFEDGRFVLAPAAANITARIVKSDGTAFGNGPGKWVNVNLQKFNADRNNWEYSQASANGDQDGYISLRAEASGTYRLRIEPNGDADATVTYSSEFEITSEQLSSFKKDFGSITLAGPSIRVSVATSSSPGTALNYAGIEIRKDGTWLDWANTNRNGVAGISLKGAGTYEFIVNPPNDLQGSAARKSYTIVATQNSEGGVTATANAGSGVSVANGVTTLLLGSPTLSGTVLAPTGDTRQAYSQVYAFNVTTGQDMWQYSTNTNANGQWAMTLPAGTYKIYGKAPWGTSTYGGSDPVGNVVVDASGAATTIPAGLTANAFTIRLKAPTWSGTVKNPGGDAVVPNARVCLVLSGTWNCVNADANGAWALSAPAGFTTFDGTNPRLVISDDYARQYPEKAVEGASAVNAILSTSGSGINLLFENANTQITVTAGGKPVANVWVSADREGSGWLGGGSTNALGVAKLIIAAPSTEFRVRVDLNGNPAISSSYSSTMKTFTEDDISDGTSGSIFSGSVALAEPNFKVVLREPSASDGTVGSSIPYSWIELYSETTGMWLGGASTDANGFASFKLDAPSSGLNNYTLTVNPAWNAATNFSRQAYAVAVSPNGTSTVVNKTTTNAVTIQTVSGRSVYPLTLGTPSVTGVVVDPSGATVANSWVVPRDAITNEYYWQQGVHSRNNGAIGLNLINGQYIIEANVPWGTSNVAKSPSCAVTVAGGTISTGGACVQDGATKTVRLALRAPNLTFTLKIGGNPVANANIGIGSGKWNTNAQSDADGKVALFVDAEAIRTLNNYNSAQPLYVWVDPPYGGSVEMARWDCASTQAKPICSGLANIPATGDYPTTALGNVTGVSPNTKIKIVAPGTSNVLPNSWVTVLAFDPSNPNNVKRWLGGGNTNTSGFASMNLETSTVPSNWKFAVEVYAPWNQRQLYATNLDTNSDNGYDWSEITGNLVLSPKSPNLTVTVNASNAVANKFGWIGVEEVNSSNVYVNWVGGYGLNENGVSSVFLAASKRFRITAYPGPGRSGARTVCIVSTNASADVSQVSGSCPSGTFTSGAVTISLDGGNVVGVVRDSSGNVLVGAVVYAIDSNTLDESTAVITSTGADGRYGLQLDPTKTWNIKVFPTGAGAAQLGIGGETGVTPPQSGSITRDITVAGA